VQSIDLQRHSGRGQKRLGTDFHVIGNGLECGHIGEATATHY
jgi:hypothetical protein